MERNGVGKTRKVCVSTNEEEFFGEGYAGKFDEEAEVEYEINTISEVGPRIVSKPPETISASSDMACITPLLIIGVLAIIKKLLLV